MAWICFTSFFCNFPPLLFCLHCHFFSFNFLQKFGSLGYRHAKSVRNCKIWTGRAGMWKVTSIIYFQWWFSQKNLANAKKGAFNKNVNGRRLCKTGDQPCCSQFAPVNLGDKISKILLKETHLKYIWSQNTKITMDKYAMYKWKQTNWFNQCNALFPICHSELMWLEFPK